MRVLTPTPSLFTRGGIALSDPQKAKGFSDSLDAKFQQVKDPSQLAVIEKALQAYSYGTASEPKLTNPMEVQDAIRNLKIGKVPDLNGLPNKALKHLPQLAIKFLVALLNPAILSQYFPTVWKHASVISSLKSAKDPSLPLLYRPISLLHTIDKPFQWILLSRILSEVSGRGLLPDQQFGFRPKLSMILQLARLVEKVTWNFGKKRRRGTNFLDVTTACDTVWFDGLLSKLTALNFPSYLVTIISYLHNRAFEAAFLTATYICRYMRAGVEQGGIVGPVQFSMYINDMPVLSLHVALALHGDNTAIKSTSRIQRCSSGI
jgi:hypothetical protein